VPEGVGTNWLCQKVSERVEGGKKILCGQNGNSSHSERNGRKEIPEMKNCGNERGSKVLEVKQSQRAPKRLERPALKGGGLAGESANKRVTWGGTQKKTQAEEWGCN